PRPGERANLGLALYDLGEFRRIHQQNPLARAALQEARDLFEDLTRKFPSVPNYTCWLADSSLQLGEVLAASGEAEQGKKLAREGIRWWGRLVQDFPGVPDHRRVCATRKERWAGVLTKAGQPAEAERELYEALKLREDLVQRFFRVPRYRLDLA